MKKIMFIFLMVFGIVSVSMAQVKKRGLITISISTPGLRCEECKKVLEQYMLREEGVTKAVADFKRKITKITFWADRTTTENVKTAIANVGFDADDVTANMEFAKKLPPCCKPL
jgi:mercuric ion binding protein